MRDILGDLRRWHLAGRRFAIARVVEVKGSAPRGPGAALAVADDGEVAGSVSTGCLEGAVVAEAMALLAGDAGSHLLRYDGAAADELLGLGLACGSSVELLVEEPGPAVIGPLVEAVHAQRPVVLATMLDGEGVPAALLVEPGAAHVGSLGDAALERLVAGDALADLDSGTPVLRRYGPSTRVFSQPFASPPHLVVVGAVDFSAALARVATSLGWRVTVCDPRPVFGTARRFPSADTVVVDWPDRHLMAVAPTLGPRDAVCVLSHDRRCDVATIAAALASGAGYVGALASRRTAAERLRGLRDAGVGLEDLVRLRSPIGLDLGARTPEETAVAIVAEIVAARTGAPVPALADRDGPVHRGGW